MERFTCTRQYLAAHSSVPSGLTAQHMESICDRTFSTMRRFFSAYGISRGFSASIRSLVSARPTCAMC